MTELSCEDWEDFPAFCSAVRDQGAAVTSIKLCPADDDIYNWWLFEDPDSTLDLADHFEERWSDQDYGIDDWEADWSTFFDPLTSLKRLHLCIEVNFPHIAWKALASHGCLESLTVKCWNSDREVLPFSLTGECAVPSLTALTFEHYFGPGWLDVEFDDAIRSGLVQVPGLDELVDWFYGMPLLANLSLSSSEGAYQFFGVHALLPKWASVRRIDLGLRTVLLDDDEVRAIVEAADDDDEAAKLAELRTARPDLHHAICAKLLRPTLDKIIREAGSSRCKPRHVLQLAKQDSIFDAIEAWLLDPVLVLAVANEYNRVQYSQESSKEQKAT